ncbi:MAG: hypothetical protein AB7G25_02980 [Sphingomonadaceae bacterium]
MSDQSPDDAQAGNPAPDGKTGYGRPPKQHQFKPRDPDAPPGKRGSRERRGPDLTAIMEKPLRLVREGRQATVHPHEVMMTELGGVFREAIGRSTRCSMRGRDRAPSMIGNKPEDGHDCAPV